jgi:5-methylcytosine-specific restriction endonuclease McrA
VADTSLPYPIVTRKEALAQGLIHYYSGVPCVRGHITVRFVNNGTCRECIRIRSVKELESNPARRDYARKNAAKWASLNRERVTANAARYRKTQDRSAVQAYQRKYRQENKATLLEREARWKRENKDRVSAYTHRRRVRELGAEGTYTPEDVQAILDSQGGFCIGINCGVDIRDCYTIDHIVPISRGGSNWPDNIWCACSLCNARKGTRTILEWLAAELAP